MCTLFRLVCGILSIQHVTDGFAVLISHDYCHTRNSDGVKNFQDIL